MSSQHRKASSSAAGGRGYGDDAGEDTGDAVQPVRLGFREMLSYGHKPWDKDYREEKRALEEAFTQAELQSRNSIPSQQKSVEEQSAYVSSDDDEDYGVEPTKFSEHEMLCYGHKPWDDDYYEMKEAYEKAFTKSERKAAAEAHREACATKSGNGGLSSVKP